MAGDKFIPFKVNLELEGEKRLSGNNLFEMLRVIKQQGSISRAASTLGFSYRYAWGLIKEAESALGLKLVEKQAGGASGGGASLTSEGLNLLEHYQSFKNEVNEELDRFVDSAVFSLEQQNLGYEQKSSALSHHLLLASTMEPVETGLLDVLEEAFYQSSGILVKHIAVGSGRALEIARQGRVDMVLTHAPELEKQFMAEGYGSQIIPVMSNKFILVGPGELIEKIELEVGAVDIFREIALRGFPFVSRGDFSGTHLQEQKIWEASDVSTSGEWYLTSSGVAGNLGILSLANEKRAFTLVDRASYILSQSKIELEIVKNTQEDSREPDLFNNVFVLSRVNPERFASINSEDVRKFARWLQAEGKQIISGFGKEKYGEPLFDLV